VNLWPQSSIRTTFLGTPGFDQASFGRRQQLREDLKIPAAGGADLQPCVHVDADHLAAWREPQLALAGEQHVPRFVLLSADQGVLAVGAEQAFRSGLASGAGQAFVVTGPAVLGPSARLEVPAAESPDPFFAAFSSTWRSVNS
jgi:hypothetical protein